MVANTLHPGKSDPQMEKMAIPIRKKKSLLQQKLYSVINLLSSSWLTIREERCHVEGLSCCHTGHSALAIARLALVSGSLHAELMDYLYPCHHFIIVNITAEVSCFNYIRYVRKNILSSLMLNFITLCNVKNCSSFIFYDTFMK